MVKRHKRRRPRRRSRVIRAVLVTVVAVSIGVGAWVATIHGRRTDHPSGLGGSRVGLRSFRNITEVGVALPPASATWTHGRDV